MNVPDFLSLYHKDTDNYYIGLQLKFYTIIYLQGALTQWEIDTQKLRVALIRCFDIVQIDY